MFSSLWRKFWSRNPAPSRRTCHRRSQHQFRPRLEPLEDRTLLTSWSGSGVFTVALAQDAISGLVQASSKPPGGTTPIQVTVNQNSPATVINLGTAFRAVSGLQHGDGLKLSILGNSNTGLVTAGLSEAALTLTYTRGKSGTATITVCATDADGVSVKQTILVTVRSPLLSGITPVPVSPVPGLKG